MSEVTKLDRRKFSKWKNLYAKSTHISLLEAFAVVMAKRSMGEEVDAEQGYHLFKRLHDIPDATADMKELALRYLDFYDKKLP